MRKRESDAKPFKLQAYGHGRTCIGMGREVIAIVTTDSPPRIPEQTRGVRFERQPKYASLFKRVHAGRDNARIFKHKLQGLQLSCRVPNSRRWRGLPGLKEKLIQRDTNRRKTHDVNLSNVEGCGRTGEEGALYVKHI